MTDTAPAAPGAPAPYDAVVLAGGAARRLGGADKPGLRVGGRALLDRVLAACAGGGGPGPARGAPPPPPPRRAGGRGGGPPRARE
ncbi:NTP transferase domain-containing protein, partial [Streptomyces tricolor]